MYQWRRNEIEILVDLYENFPSLYAVKSANYHNRNLKRTAFEDLTKQLNIRLNKNINVEEVKNKITKLRTQFFEVTAKIKASQISGAGEDDIYKPTWYLYKRLEFILPHVKRRERRNLTSSSCSREQHVQPDVHEQDFLISESQSKMEHDDITFDEVVQSLPASHVYTGPLEARSMTKSPEFVDSAAFSSNMYTEACRTEVTPSSSNSNESQRPTKRKMNDSDDFLKEVRQAIQQLSAPALKNVDELDYFFNYIKAETRKLGTEAQEYVKKHCFNSIFEAKNKFK